MKKMFLIILSFFCISCEAQSNEKKLSVGELVGKELNGELNEEKSAADASDKVANEPEVNIKVDKKYDDDGNLIGYDSTYSYVYRSFNGDTMSLDMDSIFSGFQPFMRQNFDFYGGDPFSGFFERDSTFYHGFFDENYFQNRFLESRKQFEEMFRRMDSLKNDFYYEQLPELKKEREKSSREI